MAIVYLGVDLAKSVFALHEVDEAGKPALAWNLWNLGSSLVFCHLSI
jgi:hypothetical protein